jgi:hypothetical protein
MTTLFLTLLLGWLGLYFEDRNIEELKHEVCDGLRFQRFNPSKTSQPSDTSNTSQPNL